MRGGADSSLFRTVPPKFFRKGYYRMKDAIKQKYEEAQGYVTGERAQFQSKYSPAFLRDIRNRLEAYFKLVVRSLRDSIPKSIGCFLLRAFQVDSTSNRRFVGVLLIVVMIVDVLRTSWIVNSFLKFYPHSDKICGRLWDVEIVCVERVSVGLWMLESSRSVVLARVRWSLHFPSPCAAWPSPHARPPAAYCPAPPSSPSLRVIGGCIGSAGCNSTCGGVEGTTLTLL